MTNPVASAPEPPIVFVSYAWEGEVHETWVEDELAARLRERDGCDVRLDVWNAAPGDPLPAFMEAAVRGSRHVLVVCTPVYKAKTDSRSGGVGYEADVMTGELFMGRPAPRKFIPVLRGGEPADAIPSWLLGRFYIDLRGGSGTDRYEQQYIRLLATLHGYHPKPRPIGPAPEPARFAPTRSPRAAPDSRPRATERPRNVPDVRTSAIARTVGHDTAARGDAEMQTPPTPVGPAASAGLPGGVWGPLPPSPNPFTWRGAIRSADDFFDRRHEAHVLESYLRGRQNCQVVGPRRVGKSSLLLHVEREAPRWDPAVRVAYLDLQDPRCWTQAGWFRRVARCLGWDPAPVTPPEFADKVEDVLSRGVRPVLCIDEFEEWSSRRAEFSREFLMTLRSISQRGMSIVTAARSPLSHLTDPDDQTSAFFNTFPILTLGRFSEADASDYVAIARVGVPPFSADTQQAILRFAGGHPLALQVACFHVVEASYAGEVLAVAMQRAGENLWAHQPG